MKKLIVFILSIGLIGPAVALPLQLEYGVNQLSGNVYRYDFFLKLDNHDNSWIAGQGWRGIIFGDAFQTASPLANFSGNLQSFSGGPWTGFELASGDHNGPALSPFLDFWVPANVGDSVHWSGFSSANLTQGQLFFSTLASTQNNGLRAIMQEAERIVVVIPEPSTIAMMLIGLGVLFSLSWFKRRRRRLL